MWRGYSSLLAALQAATDTPHTQNKQMQLCKAETAPLGILPSLMNQPIKPLLQDVDCKIVLALAEGADFHSTKEDFT